MFFFTWRIPRRLLVIVKASKDGLTIVVLPRQGASPKTRSKNVPSAEANSWGFGLKTEALFIKEIAFNYRARLCWMIILRYVCAGSGLRS